MRRLYSLMFLLFTIMYMAVVIYAPSVALAPLLGIETWALILVY